MMDEKNDLIVLESSVEKTRVGGQERLDEPPYDIVHFTLKDGERIYEKEFGRFQLVNEIEKLRKAGKGVPYEYVNILKLL
jgi:hypothetical protein